MSIDTLMDKLILVLYTVKYTVLNVLQALFAANSFKNTVRLAKDYENELVLSS